MPAFQQAFKIVVGEEGGFGANPADPGNWTGGACGAGALVGTKYGIAASAHPTLDIPNLTLDQARNIYEVEYWHPVHGDQLPPSLALLVFDAAVNNGVGRAVRWLQAALGVAVDGQIGPATLTAIALSSGSGAVVSAEFQAQRLLFMAGLPTWRTFGRGWARRLTRLPYDALQMGA